MDMTQSPILVMLMEVDWFSISFFPIKVLLSGWVFLCLVSLPPMLFLSYVCLSRPLRRQERARLILDLIETGTRDGRRIEETITSVSASRDPSLGIHFHLLAACLEQGLPLSQALDRARGVLPPTIVAMLQAGLKIGDLQKVFPACRQLLKDAVSQTRGAVNYLVLLAFLTTPTTLYALLILSVFVLPKFTEVMNEMMPNSPMGVAPAPPHTWLFALLQLPILFALCFLAVCYIGGPALNSRFRRIFGSVPDRIQYTFPWRRKRMQRDFSTMLAVLLDAGVPESEALELAGDCTANDIFRQRVARARAGLAQGLKLAQAVEMIDDSGEFRWRLTQAIGRQGGFVTAIAGWKDALDAKAFQQEQATAQVATTALVLLNGVFVATIALSIFGMLISIINAELLW
ncbi:MAG TPA: type II secretion system F family protein [Verrucomicrobiae bacterium]|nr:type II secretion system F family protein [Verrucomicrobiae bacterium]